jgi:hypothetical protein
MDGCYKKICDIVGQGSIDQAGQFPCPPQAAMEIEYRRLNINVRLELTSRVNVVDLSGEVDEVAEVTCGWQREINQGAWCRPTKLKTDLHGLYLGLIWGGVSWG